MFREGLLSLMTNIAYIRQSNLLEHFLETRLRQGYCSDHSTMSLNIGQNLRLWFFYSFMEMTRSRYTAISRKVVGKNVRATIPKGNMGYDQYTVPDDCSCRTFFCCFPLALANTFPWPFVPILSNFFEKQRTQNHPQCLSRLSRALFPTTFLEIAVYSLHRTSDYGNYTRRLYTAGQLQIVYHALPFFPTKRTS